MEKDDMVVNKTNNSVAVNAQSATFVSEVRQIIDEARNNAVRSVDFCRVHMYWNIGRRIFEEEQQGKDRADYGTYLIKNLSENLEPEYGSGFSYRQLAFCRQFYLAYPIVNALRSQLNWTQYRMLIQIQDPDKREYYELEAVNIAESLGIDKEWIETAREILNIPNSVQLESLSDLNMANSPYLNPSNSRGLKTKGVEFDPLGEKGGNA